jgi:Putative transposase
LLQHSAAALLDVGRAHKDLGAELGLLAVLQTWTRDLRFHPHVHCVVPAGGLSADGLRWIRPRRANYFLPEGALAMRLRNRLKQALQQDHGQLFSPIPKEVWSRDWVADVQFVGSGEPALKYLAAYVYRTAFSAERILRDDGQQITFTYRDGKDHRIQTVRLAPEQFLHRFLQHVLPKGFQRVRYFGWLSPAAKSRFERITALLDWRAPARMPPAPLPPPLCPGCNKPMALLGRLARAPPLHRS